MRKRGGIRAQRISTDLLTLLLHLSRVDAPTPKSPNSEDELPEDYPVVKNMLHRLTGKEGRREGMEQVCLRLALSKIIKSFLMSLLRSFLGFVQSITH